MLEIAAEKIAQVIMEMRALNEQLAVGSRGDSRPLREFIADLNEDEQAALTAVMWIGRDSFAAEELDAAIAAAIDGRTVATEDYLLGEPRLADYLEMGMEALGLSYDEAQAALNRPL